MLAVRREVGAVQHPSSHIDASFARIARETLLKQRAAQAFQNPTGPKTIDACCAKHSMGPGEMPHEWSADDDDKWRIAQLEHRITLLESMLRQLMRGPQGPGYAPAPLFSNLGVTGLS